MIKIAIDAMGGDFAPKEQVEGTMMAIQNIPDIECTLYGDETEIRKYLTNDERITIVQSEGSIDMGEKDPISAIRRNRKSSLAMALTSVRKNENDGIVSSGATQALIAGAHILVGRMKTMKRTAIAPLIPTINGGSTILIDSGANIEIKAEYMIQQAHYAHVYAQEVLNIKDPKIGLINIGTEEGKGRSLDQEVYRLLKANQQLNFVGNVEPKQVLNPPCDILLSDGFTANIVMKTIEGTAKGMGQMLKTHLSRGVLGKLGLLFSVNNLKRFKKGMSADEIGGAMIYGLRGVVVKAQGASKKKGFYNGIRQTAVIIRNDVVNKVSKVLESEAKQ
jgi:glycerol-3-phosphate acyltransferase PlsX